MLDHFRVARFDVVLRATETVHLPPYAGSTLRGAFGHAFRRVACPFRQCPPCLVPSSCPYTYIFETPPPADAAIMGRCTAAPHPFIFEPPPAGEGAYMAGDEIRFGLVLIGRAIEFLPYFAYALHEMAEHGLGRGRGRAELVEILDVTDSDGAGRRVYDGVTQTLLARPSGNGHPPRWTRPDGTDGGSVAIRFLTPTRLKFGERLTSDLQFHILWRNLLRRVSALSYFHCGRQLEWDFRGSIARAERVACADRRIRWVDWERYSARQGTSMLMGGFVGEASFEGGLAEFLPALRLGELVHVGKGTVFGLGKYSIGGKEAGTC